MEGSIFDTLASEGIKRKYLDLFLYRTELRGKLPCEGDMPEYQYDRIRGFLKMHGIVNIDDSVNIGLFETFTNVYLLDKVIRNSALPSSLLGR